MQCCNLTEINVSNIVDQHDFNDRARAASIIGTLQASYTDFHYLRDSWRVNCQKDSLLGVSTTGVASVEFLKLNKEEAAIIALNTNEEFAVRIGINKAARVTTLKPAGTTSLVFGTSSGVHAWHDYYYWRRMRISKNESIYKYLLDTNPTLIEDDYFNPTTTAIIKVPQKAPDGAITRSESAIDLLNRVGVMSKEWINPGFRSGYNQHNVSCTVSIKPDEWDEVCDWMWNNRAIYSGIAVLPYDDHGYKQAPFESCTKEEYDAAVVNLKNVDLTKVVEGYDETSLMGEVACGGSNGCEVT